MKKLLLSGFILSACMMNAQTIVDSQAELEKLFVQAPFDFGGLPEDGGGDVWYAENWNVPVIAADFNGDGNKDVFLSGNVSFGEVSTPSPTNILYLGDGAGGFNAHLSPCHYSLSEIFSKHSASEIPFIRNRFCREVSPPTMEMADFGSASFLAKKAIRALLALPSTGGDAIAILSRPPCSPTMADLLAPG